jgi:putative endonuclease
MLASKRNGMLYAGFTPDLMRRVFMHKKGIASHFTRKHMVTSLVWYEPHNDLHSAATRCDQIKHNRRQWKLRLIESANPEWIDLYHIIEALPQMPIPSLIRSKPAWLAKC